MDTLKQNDDSDKSVHIKQVYNTLNRKFEEQEAQRRAAKSGMQYFNLAGFPIDQNALGLIPRERAEACGVIIFYREASLLKIAVTEPDKPELKVLLKDLEKDKFQIELYLVSHGALSSAYQQYRKILTITRSHAEIEVPTGALAMSELKALASAKDKLIASPMTLVLNLIISGGATMRASDIHLEPEKTFIKLRYRVDGVLQEILEFPVILLHPLLSRIKLLSGLKLNVTSTPQDGRFSVKIGGKSLDLRVSVLPSAFGESVVIRLLGLQDIELDIATLGLRGRSLEIIYQELRKPNGMVLTTGPTGSGKTTSLYAFLNFLNKAGVKIITLEDPVEYQLEGLVQTPIDRGAGMSFASGLRSVLRQDPDIVMVGEIRDLETAEAASQAALTGHMVISTLHTNDAAGAIPRLLNLGVSPVTLAPALNALIAQRLLRKICVHCKEVYRPNAEELARVKLVISKIPPEGGVKIPVNLVFYRGKGCEQCHKIGYFGRIGVFEVFAVSDEIKELIFQRASTTAIQKLAVEQGMVTMQQDAIIKALDGLTDLSEVWRVTE